MIQSSNRQKTVILFLIVISFLLFSIPTVSFADDAVESWVKKYNGPGENGLDSATAIALDLNGNVYVTGYSSGNGTSADYATIKYDSSGNELWVKRYNGPASGEDRATAIAVDTNGNIYITGYSYDNGTNYDYATIKYDTNGNELWVKRYNGAGNGEDRATAIALDSSGSIYVTGYSLGNGTNYDYATIKYDSSGNELWVKRYNGPASGEDRATTIAIDGNENVYVTGFSFGNGSSIDYATVKYDSSGNEIWVKRYNGTGNNGDSATAIAIDSNGNIYVTGYSFGNGTSADYATIKYDSSGNELWVKKYNGPANYRDEATAITVDINGNVYVTGYSSGGEANYDYDYATVKYDASGNELWVKRYKGSVSFWDKATAITVDINGNVYVTGYSSGGEANYDYDYATVKYDASGNELWVKRYKSPGYSNDSATAIAIDTNGNIYITGYSSGNGTSYDYATAKYDTNGNELWVKKYNNNFGNGWDSVQTIALDTNGNIYVTGFSFGGGTDYDYATVRYDTNGNELWVKRYNGLGNGDDRATAIVVDKSGSIYVTGYSLGNGTNYDYATIKYDSSGNELWVKRYNGPASGEDRATTIVVDTNGNVYVTGFSFGNGSSTDYATVKYDSSGNEIWVKRYNGTGNNGDSATAIAIDTNGNIYVTGYSVENGSSYDYATIKYDSSGNELWVRRYNGIGNIDDYANAIALDANGNVYVTGATAVSSDRTFDYATIKYDINGNELWVKRYNGPANYWDEATNIVVDKGGSIYVTGYSLGSGTDYDYATVKYDINGNELWVKRYNGPGNTGDYASALAFDKSGNIYVTGSSGLRGGTNFDCVTVKYNSSGNELWTESYNGPANDWDYSTGIGVDGNDNVYISGGSYNSGTNYDYITIKYTQTITPPSTSSGGGGSPSSGGGSSTTSIQSTPTGKIKGRIISTSGLAILGLPARIGNTKVATNLNGEFEFSGLLDGVYIVFYEVPGYDTQTQVLVVSRGEATIAPTVIMSPSLPAGKIKGRIINTSGLAILGTPVAINGIRTATNLNGEFEFTFVADGVYTLFYDSLGYVSQSQILVVLNGGITIGPTVVMSPSVISSQTVSSVKGKKGRRVRKVVRVRKKVVKRKR